MLDCVIHFCKNAFQGGECYHVFATKLNKIFLKFANFSVRIFTEIKAVWHTCGAEMSNLSEQTCPKIKVAGELINKVNGKTTEPC